MHVQSEALLLALKGKKAEIPLLYDRRVVTQQNLVYQREPWGAFSLLFNNSNPSNRLVRRKGSWVGITPAFRLESGALSMVSENPRD